MDFYCFLLVSLRSSAWPPVDNRTLFEKNEKGDEILIRKLSLVK